MKFTKMQGIGNDYIYLDCVRGPVPRDPSALARRVSDRHFGIGGDGLVLILPGDEADFRMRMYNADGSEAEMCGNASRCVGKYVYDRGLTDRTEVRLETGAGVKMLRLLLKNGTVSAVQVDMGAPALRPEQIPARMDDDSGALIHVPMQVADRVFQVTCVSMGNPHCVVFQDEVEDWPIESWGPRFEHHSAFPRRINTEFARVLDRETIRMRVWERGSGETLACGTGACATLVAAVLNGLTEREATLKLNGGDLRIRWDEASGHVLMTGPAAFVFDGNWDEKEDAD
ncbi:MAG: diaminopimelate epimerase [Clostridia bacterium]|nr:diaminopimelate epimerase [Clostridia bacterium]